MALSKPKMNNKFLGELAFKIENKTAQKVDLGRLISTLNDSDVVIYETLEQFYNSEFFNNYMREELIDEFLIQLETEVNGTFSNAKVGDIIFEAKDNQYIIGGLYVCFEENSLECVYR